jgi:hypothetical protein
MRRELVDALLAPSLWQRLLCKLQMCFMELERIEQTYEDDVRYHRCPYCGRTSVVVDVKGEV